MKIEINIMGRATGKTTMAIERFLKNPHDSVLAADVYWGSQLFRFERNIPTDRLIRLSNLKKMVVVARSKNIIIDELAMLEPYEQVDIYMALHTLMPHEVIIYTSLRKAYSKSLFNFIKESKKHHIRCRDVYTRLRALNKNFTPGEVEELYYNFLTDKNTIVNSDYPVNEDLVIKSQGRVNDRLFNVEIRNQWLIDDTKQHPELFIASKP